VSCVGAKRADASKAKDLYVSDWFKKVRSYVERSGYPWSILSAQYGLIDPESVIAPYEKTLNRMRVGERRAWGARVIVQMETSLPQVDQIIVFAGAKYREFLMDYLRSRGHEVLVPLEGLRIGEQLHWLSTHSSQEGAS
jgi:hypothetical protein